MYSIDSDLGYLPRIHEEDLFWDKNVAGIGSGTNPKNSNVLRVGGIISGIEIATRVYSDVKLAQQTHSSQEYPTL